MKTSADHKEKRSGSLAAAAIAIVFLVLGFQTALLIYRAAVDSVVAHRDHPDTVFVMVPEGTDIETVSWEPVAGNEQSGTAAEMSSGGGRPAQVTVRKNASHSPRAEEIRRQTRRVESFRFNPNTASQEDLERLGFSEKQAQSIIHYREKGGIFHRKEDFQKSYVVADSVYERLEPYIDIPLVDINRADSVALLALPGIGPFYAGKIVSYRSELGGYSYAEQLLDLWKFDEEKLAGLRDLIKVGPSEPFALWTLPEEELSRHPYISRSAAHGIVLFRDNNPREKWTVDALAAAGILRDEDARRLARCRIAEPQE